MFSTFITVTLFISIAIRDASAGFAISNPDFHPCEPAKVSWAPGSGMPYYFEVVSPDDPCGPALDTIDGLNTTVLHYTPKFPQGKQVVLYVFDSEDNEARSATITIGSSSNNSCLPGGSSSTTLSHTATPVVKPSHTSSSTSSSATDVSGALNAQSNPFSGGLSVHQASKPLLSITAMAAMLALTL